jgi:hypothetical protein
MKMEELNGSTNIFNMSLATLQRIDNILKSLNLYYSSGMYTQIQNTLFCLYKELYPFLNKKEKEEALGLWNEVYKRKMYKNMEDKKVYYSKDLFDYMNNFEFWIRDKLNQKGLLMAKTEQPELALGRI